MDGRGRLAQSLTWVFSRGQTTAGARAPARPVKRTRWHHFGSLINQFVQHRLEPLVQQKLPRGAGMSASLAILALSIGFGIARGDRGPEVLDVLAEWRDAAANAAGFGIQSIAMAGNRQVIREEVLATAGITGQTSLLFLNVDTARDKLQTNPWIAEATLLKLYPGALKISVVERKAFALWQSEGRVSVIAADGTVLEPYVARRFTNLPLIVGKGAETQARDFLALIDRFPDLAGQVRAAILVAERRWNLRLKNGIDVRLPESDVEAALANLVKLDADKKLLSRDITEVDLRLPDRVTVRLSDAAAAAREEALKAKAKQRKGTSA